jgi:hypothetical protein
MERLADLFSEQTPPEPIATRAPTSRVLESLVDKRGSKTVPAQFEDDVFNFLLAHKEELGISELVRFTSSSVDGAIQLHDGRRLALEIKYRMNWQKACQAGWQISQFLRTAEARERPVRGGLVVFEEFNEDWVRPAKKRLLEVGWSNWYTGHCEVEGVRVELVRLRDGAYQSFPAALAAARGSIGSGRPR